MEDDARGEWEQLLAAARSDARSDARRPRRVACVFAWVLAAAGAVLWLRTAHALGLLSDWDTKSWPLTWNAVWFATMFVAFGASALLTAATALPRATERSAVAGTASAGAELLAALVVGSWFATSQSLGPLICVMVFVPVMLHALASLAGFIFAWSALRPDGMTVV